MGGAFERLAKSVLNRLGQDAFLVSGASTTPCRANVEHGVQVAGAYDDAVFNRDVATLDRALGAKVGDTLQHPSGNYKLDGVLADNGFTVRFTLQPA
mgnify:FL=1